MSTALAPLQVRLFYSYSHRDASYREAMESRLAILQQERLLHQWSDQSILPGEKLSSRIRTEMDKADVIVFLVSSDFISSDECMKEWTYAKDMYNTGRPIIRIPIIIRECAWKDLLVSDDVKALPVDGICISSFDDPDTAWMQVYEGVKKVIHHIRNTFTPKHDFLSEFEKTEFLSHDDLNLRQLYVFPNLANDGIDTSALEPLPRIVSDHTNLLTNNRSLVHGTEKAGKTGLLKHLHLTLIGSVHPSLFLDLANINFGGGNVLRDAYDHQFHGDFGLWIKQQGKTLLLDNLDERPAMLEFITSVSTLFDTIVVTTSTEHYYAYFRDEELLAEFTPFRIEMLTATQQESLIRKRFHASDTIPNVTDGLVDRAERNVNSVIISSKIVPRHPFFVLSILQTYEAYMPENISITSYGHCYYVLIIAKLRSLGISTKDADVNTCFNFAEHLAFAIYQHDLPHNFSRTDFDIFLETYRSRYLIPGSMVARLCDDKSGIFSHKGTFKAEYMYYYFLAKYLANNAASIASMVSDMCDNIHRSSNYLTLLFLIHHSNDFPNHRRKFCSEPCFP